MSYKQIGDTFSLYFKHCAELPIVAQGVLGMRQLLYATTLRRLNRRMNPDGLPVISGLLPDEVGRNIFVLSVVEVDAAAKLGFTAGDLKRVYRGATNTKSRSLKFVKGVIGEHLGGIIL